MDVKCPYCYKMYSVENDMGIKTENTRERPIEASVICMICGNNFDVLFVDKKTGVLPFFKKLNIKAKVVKREERFAVKEEE